MDIGEKNPDVGASGVRTPSYRPYHNPDDIVRYPALVLRHAKAAQINLELAEYMRMHGEVKWAERLQRDAKQQYYRFGKALVDKVLLKSAHSATIRAHWNRCIEEACIDPEVPHRLTYHFLQSPLSVEDATRLLTELDVHMFIDDGRCYAASIALDRPVADRELAFLHPLVGFWLLAGAFDRDGRNKIHVLGNVQYRRIKGVPLAADFVLNSIQGTPS